MPSTRVQVLLMVALHPLATHLQRMRVENELLREQLRIVRSNCSYYRDVEMEVDETPAPVAP